MINQIYLLLIPITIPLLLFIAAIFAASEAALFSLSRPQLEWLKEFRPSTYRRVRALLKKPDALLFTMIIGNECLNILIGTMIVTLLEHYLHSWEQKHILPLSVLVSSILLLVFSEVFPKVLAFRFSVLAASILVYPATWAHVLLTPPRKVFLFISSEILKLLRIKPAAPSAINEKDFLTLVEVGAESGSLDRDEKEMIYNVFHFSDRPVSSVMTPWKDVFTIESSLSVKEILERVRQKTFSRIPILSKNDHVVGILYTKELLKLLLNPKAVYGNEILEDATFAPYIVSTHKKISKLFREFKLKKIHIALVVDEYGRHLGVVTLEDVLNALFQTQRKLSNPEERQAT